MHSEVSPSSRTTFSRDADYSERSANWPTRGARAVRAPLRKASASRLNGILETFLIRVTYPQ